MIGATYEIVLDGICPNGYCPLTNETECKALAGQTISNIGLVGFSFSGCYPQWTPAQTCFTHNYWVDTNDYLYFADKDCGQIPDYETHRLVCKKQGNNFLTFEQHFNSRNIHFISNTSLLNSTLGNHQYVD